MIGFVYILCAVDDIYCESTPYLQCFDPVGWVMGRASSLWKALLQ